MKSKKLCCALLIGGLISSSYIFTYYSRQETTSQTAKVTNTEPLKKITYHVEETADNPHGSYKETFWVENNDGENLIFDLKNNGKKSVNYKITHGTSAIRSSGIIEHNGDMGFEVVKERAGKWTITINNDDGSRMKVKVKVKQFD